MRPKGTGGRFKTLAAVTSTVWFLLDLYVNERELAGIHEVFIASPIIERKGRDPRLTIP
jgi:hypothetical protein